VSPRCPVVSHPLGYYLTFRGRHALREGVGALRDIALVVVGFYFGSQRRVLEIETQQGKIKQVIEHENPAIVAEAKPGAPKSGIGTSVAAERSVPEPQPPNFDALIFGYYEGNTAEEQSRTVARPLVAEFPCKHPLSSYAWQTTEQSSAFRSNCVYDRSTTLLPTRWLIWW
jgi:hypothetical protein